MPNPKTPATGADHEAATRKRNPQRIATILASLERGDDYLSCASLAGVTYETVRIWRRADPELSVSFDRAAAIGRGKRVDKLIDLCDSDDERIALKATMFWLSRRTQEYREKVEAAVTIEDKRQVLVVPERADNAEDWLEKTAAARMGEN